MYIITMAAPYHIITMTGPYHIITVTGPYHYLFRQRVAKGTHQTEGREEAIATAGVGSCHQPALHVDRSMRPL